MEDQICLYIYLLVQLIKNKPINLFNKGKMGRSFTYIDDVVDSLIKLISKIPRKIKIK